MYTSISLVPKEEMEKIKEISKSWGIILRDAEESDFEKVVCNNGMKEFTKDNLISEISKLKFFPDYVVLPDEWGDIHVVYYGRSHLTDDENEKVGKIFKGVFGIVNYI